MHTLTKFAMVSVPGAPVNVDLTPSSTTSLYVSWDEPSELNGVITSYTVAWIQDGHDMTEDVYGVMTLKLDNLTSCQGYTVTVSGNTTIGRGSESDPVTGEANVESEYMI